MSREDIFDKYERETYHDMDKPETLKEPIYCRECGDEISDPEEELCEFCTESAYFKP
jgi:hypothetical protein